MIQTKIFKAPIFAIIILLALLFCGGCGSDNAGGADSGSLKPAETSYKAPAENDMPADEESKSDSGKILVAYFSATGNTKPIAEYAANIIGADIFEIVPKDPYTDEDLNYNDSASRATVEQNDPSARPEISGTVENMSQYDTVIIAYPIWWGKEPKIIDTFIESYDFTGKTMTTLCTSGGSGIETSASNIRNAVSNVNWLESRRFKTGATESDVEKWLNEIGLK